MVVETRDEVTRLRVPETGFVLGVRYGGSARFTDDGSRLPKLSLVGVSRHARPMRTSANGAVLLARFHPAGAARVFGNRLHEFFGLTESLDSVFRRSELDRLQSRVEEARSDSERVATLERFLIEHTRRDSDALIAHALNVIHNEPGIRVRELAQRVGLSHDAFEKRFRREVGCAPKQFVSLTRVHSVLSAHRPGTSFTQLALEAGYFDQPHFNREFRAVLGVAPGEYFRPSPQPSRVKRERGNAA